MKKTRVAVFNTQPPQLYFGGVERRILEIAKKLSKDHDISIYCGTKKGFKATSHINGAAIVPCRSTDIFFPLDNWAFNRTISGMVDSIEADVYEAHAVSGYAFLRELRSRKIRKPFVQTIHGVLADEYLQSSKGEVPTFRTKLSNLLMWQLSKLESEAAKNATILVTVSQYSAHKIIQLYDVDETKIRIVPNGVDTEKFKPAFDTAEIRQKIGFAQGKKYVLFVGRLVPRKGLNYLVEAAEHVLEENKETVFVVVGEGPLKNNLISAVKKYRLSSNFVFLSIVSDSLLQDLYSCVNLFVLPSIQEGQGMALLEAQAAALPIVAFDVSGVREAVRDKETGLLVKEIDSNSLSEAILKLLSDKSLRRKMGQHGREFVQKNFTWDVCAEKMLQVYNEASNMCELGKATGQP
jgi:glycosyltransferase involved in cell wall biosynthesis